MRNDATTISVNVPDDLGDMPSPTQQPPVGLYWQAILDDALALLDLVADTVVALQIATYFNRLYVLGLGINAADAILGIIAGMAQMANARLAKRHSVEKFFWGMANTILNGQIFAFGVLATLIKYGKLVGTTAKIGNIFFSFAACAIMWGAASYTTRRFYKATRKRDIGYLAQDRLLKYQIIAEKINLTQDDLQKEALLETQERVKFQAIALLKVGKVRKLSFDRYTIDDKPLDTFVSEKFNVDMDTMPTQQEKSVVAHLLMKQQEKQYTTARETVEWLVGAVGVTLIAFSPLLPVLVIPGVILSFLASTSQLLHLFKQHIIERIERNVALKAKKTELLATTKAIPSDWVEQIDNALQTPVVNFIKHKDKKELTLERYIPLLYYSYMNSRGYTGNQQNFGFFERAFYIYYNSINLKAQYNVKKQLQNNYAMYCENLYLAYQQSLDDTALENKEDFADFVKNHFAMTQKQQKNTLDQAAYHAAEDAIIKETLALEATDTIPLVISEKDREGIINRYANTHYSITSQIIDFFTHRKTVPQPSLATPKIKPSFSTQHRFLSWLNEKYTEFTQPPPPEIKMDSGVNLIN